MAGTLKSAASTEVVALVKEVEGRCDNWAKNLRLLNFPHDVAAWGTLTQIVDLIEQSIQQFGHGSIQQRDAMINLGRAGAQLLGTLRTMQLPTDRTWLRWTPELRIATNEAVRVAHNCENFAGCFIAWHQDRMEVEIISTDRLRFSAPPSSLHRRIRAHQQGRRIPAWPSTADNPTDKAFMDGADVMQLIGKLWQKVTLEGDIKGCFDNIGHQWLLDNVPMNKAILHKWLKSGYLEKQVFYDTISGTPQGGIISPALSNITLDGLERRLREVFPVRGKGSERGRAAQVHLIRYADDFIITGHSEELLRMTVKPLVESFLAERGLVLSSEKTLITHIEKGFDFLGQNIRRYPHGKLFIKPARKSVVSVLVKVKQIVREHLGSTAHLLINRLNPIVKGWANYHRHVVSKRVFARVDAAIFRMLWRWAKARHPRKGAGWIRQKYFDRVRTRDWWFFGDTVDAQGSSLRVRLFHAASARIVRHVKVRSSLNPYDPSWTSYLSRRYAVAPHRARS